MVEHRHFMCLEWFWTGIRTLSVRLWAGVCFVWSCRGSETRPLSEVLPRTLCLGAAARGCVVRRLPSTWTGAAVWTTLKSSLRD